jgi:hypothetical protein
VVILLNPRPILGFDIVLDVIHSPPKISSAPKAYTANEVAATENGF